VIKIEKEVTLLHILWRRLTIISTQVKKKKFNKPKIRKLSMLFMLDRAERGYNGKEMTDNYEVDARLLGRSQQLISVNQEAHFR